MEEEEKRCQCQYFSNCTVINGGCCSHPEAQREFGKTVSLTICEVCPWYTGPSRGLGDDIHKIARITGLDKAAKVVEKVTGKPCGCAQRRARLNRRSRRPG